MVRHCAECGLCSVELLHAAGRGAQTGFDRHCRAAFARSGSQPVLQHHRPLAAQGLRNGPNLRRRSGLFVARAGCRFCCLFQHGTQSGVSGNSWRLQHIKSNSHVAIQGYLIFTVAWMPETNLLPAANVPTFCLLADCYTNASYDLHLHHHTCASERPKNRFQTFRYN